MSQPLVENSIHAGLARWKRRKNFLGNAGADGTYHRFSLKKRERPVCPCIFRLSLYFSGWISGQAAAVAAQTEVRLSLSKSFLIRTLGGWIIKMTLTGCTRT